MKKKKAIVWKYYILGGIAVVFILYLTLSFLPEFFMVSYGKEKNSTSTSETVIPKEKPWVATHIKTPEAVKGIYMSQCVVGTPSFRNKLINLIDETELNSVVIDIKDYTGRISFNVKDPTLKEFVSDKCKANDMQDFIESLHKKNIYVIGRITVFQDPYFTKLHPELAVKKLSDKTAVWKDRKGLSFVDVGARPYWDYMVKLSKESYNIGFDELNYDYVRFPSDGDMKDIYFSQSEGKTKALALEEFFKYLRDSLNDTGVKLSADLFGMTTTSHDDMNIGQVLERAMPYFDYIDPMVYPSHYPNNFNGWADPNKHPYDIVNFAMKSAVDRTVATTTDEGSIAYERVGTTTPAIYKKPSYDKLKMRPWLQDNDYPVPYTPEMVRAQIQATYDVGLNSWMLWDAANTYTQSALIPAK